MSGSSSYADWIAVDWGTTHLRAWAMAEDGTVRAEARSDDGMGHLARDAFEPALLSLVEPWLGAGPMDVLACGMVGSRQGWAEAPYVAVPAKARDALAVPVATKDPRLRVAILPGLKQAVPPDVMRGEETQIAGFLAAAPGFDGVLCLPGTHAKWVQISAGEVVSFRTFMTGELFDLLSGAIGPAPFDRRGWCGPRRLPRGRVRHAVAAGDAGAAAVLDPGGAAAGRDKRRGRRARLSGYLIGAELAAARPYWLGQEVVVAGAPALAEVYAKALATQGVTGASAMPTR
jgi:2-dehydro-3-deoxygalactonokinase